MKYIFIEINYDELNVWNFKISLEELIIMKFYHNLIKNWDEKWKINKMLDFFP